MRYQDKIVTASVLSGLFIWVLSAFLDRFVFFTGHGTYWDFLIFGFFGHEIYARILMLLIFVIFGLIASKAISKSKLAEADLKKSESRLVEAQHLAKMGDFTWDVETGEATWSDALYDLLKYDQSEIVDYTKVNERIHHPEDIKRVTEWLNDCVDSDSDELTPNEYRLICRNGEVIWVRTVGTIQRRQGRKPLVFATIQDITDSKRAEEALRESEGRVRKKLDAILTPEGDLGKLELSDIIDIKAVQSVVDDLNRVTHVAMAVIDLNGKVLVASGWQDICSKFHRTNPESCKYCTESDTELTKDIEQGKSKIYHCKHNIYDAATPLMLGDRRIGNLFLGQFLFVDEEPEREVFLKQAKRYGFNEKEYMEALDRVPRFTHDEIDKLLKLFCELSGFISAISDSNVRLARSLEDRKHLIESLRGSEERYRIVVDQTGQILYDYDVASGLLKWFGNIEQITGYSHDEFQLVDIDGWEKLIHPEDRDAILVIFERSRKEVGKFKAEYRLRRKDGSFRYIEDEGVFLPGSDGKAYRMLGSMRDVTERKLTEERLKSSKTFIDRIIDESPFATWISDEMGTIIRSNRALRRTLNVTDDQIIGKYNILLDKNLADQGLLAEVRSVYEDLKLVRFRVHWSLANVKQRGLEGTSELYIDASLFPIVNSNGELTNVVCQWMDITERVQSEKALKKSEEEYRLTVDKLLVGVVVHDANSRVLISNPEASRILGLTVDQMLGKKATDPLWSFVYQDMSPMKIEDYPVNRVISTKQPLINYELGIRRPDIENITWVNVNAMPLLAEDGTLEKVVVNFIDITERKRAVEEIINLSKFPSENPSPVIRVRDDGMALYANDAAKNIMEVWGICVGEVVPKDWFDWLYSEFESNKPVVKERLIAGSSYSFEISPLPELGYVNLYGRNITEQRRVEDELKVYRDHLEELVRDRTYSLELANKELESFSYSVSHDLRSPLRAIDGFSKILLEDCRNKLDDAGVEHIYRIRKATQRMGRLINDLLGLSRITRKSISVEPIQFSEMVSDIASELLGNDNKRNVVFKIDPEMHLCADPGLMRVVMENLIGNAWKFTSKNETAVIEIGTENLDGEDVFFVRDDGAGFDMKYADKLFGVFQRLHTKKEFEGVGVGLATVERVISRHGGRVWASGVVGKGATFYFLLPDINYHLNNKGEDDDEE